MDKAYRDKRFYSIVIASIALFGIIEIAVIRCVFPSSYMHLLWLIPAYFLLLGFITLILLRRMKRKKLHPGKAIARLMLFNVSQMLVSFTLLFLFYYFVKDNKNVFIIAFALFYIFFMSIKFYIILDINRQNKKSDSLN